MVLTVEKAGWAPGHSGTWMKCCAKLSNNGTGSNIHFILFLFLSLAY